MHPASFRPARRGWSLLTALVLALAVLVVSAPSVARADDEPVTRTDLLIDGTPERDGTAVKLDVSILETAGSAPRPAIVLNHGFGGTKDDSVGIGETLARDGYVVITWTQRGFGRSGGKIHLDNPAYEGRDAARIVDLVASRPEVAKQGDDDPVVGFAGASYGGAISLVAAGLDPRIDAIAPTFTWHSLRQALFPQYALADDSAGLADVRPTDAAGVFKQRWASLFFLSGSGGGSGDACGRFSADICAGYAQAATTGRASPELLDLLDASGPAKVLAKITAPTLLVQGEADTLFPLDEAEANARGLPTATPAKIIWSAGGHDGGIDLDGLLPELTGWFGRYLKQDKTAVDASFDYAVPASALVGQGTDDDPEVRTLSAYPGLSADLAVRSLSLTGGSQTIVRPAGGSPAALTNLPGTGGALSAISTVGGYALGVLPGQSATYTSAPLDATAPLVGSGRASLQLTATTTSAMVFVSLWDLGPDREVAAGSEGAQTGGTAVTTQPSSAVLPQLTVSPVAVRGLTPGRPTTVEVALPAVAHDVPVGHRLQLVVSATDQAYRVPDAQAAFQVALVDGSITLPVVTGRSTTPAVDVPAWLVIMVAALVVVALAGLVIMMLRRRSVRPREDLREVPLHVEGLVKTYKDGLKAVDGVSFAAQRGQVVGLLGPNGAGKTTTMRMLVGLIRPDAGNVYVTGEPVQAGSDVLASVGAFIEGPGFLPHLTGMQNLRAFWEATGRPLEEARLDSALAIANLGSAVDRRVRGYSQGMRQRLGIAQAMLGLPDLLLLDEPTNGLDPPQIKAMRKVLADYAAAGRTVVVSSHLLAEVQQTCSHVVVMNKGTVVLEGSVAELTTSNDVTLVSLADAAQTASAVALVAARGGAAVVDEDGLHVHGGPQRADLVRLLVEGGIGIDAVDSHRQLEEVFMSLVGDGEPGGTR